jgi:hypothetical protein
MTAEQHDCPDKKDPVHDPDGKGRDSLDGFGLTHDGVEEPPRRVATEAYRKKEQQQLSSRAGLKLLKRTGTTGLCRCTPMSCNVEGQIGKKQINDTP